MLTGALAYQSKASLIFLSARSVSLVHWNACISHNISPAVAIKSQHFATQLVWIFSTIFSRYIISRFWKSSQSPTFLRFLHFHFRLNSITQFLSASSNSKPPKPEQCQTYSAPVHSSYHHEQETQTIQMKSDILRLQSRYTNITKRYCSIASCYASQQKAQKRSPFRQEFQQASPKNYAQRELRTTINQQLAKGRYIKYIVVTQI